MNVRRLLLPTLAAAAAMTLFGACSSTGKGDDASQLPSAERIGVYDGRAVAIAYAGSDRFDQWIKALRAEHDAAKERGDTKRADELEAKAVAQQERFHGQAFRGEKVDDVLATVADLLPPILAEAGVTRIERINEERASEVPTVDVTDRLVALFDPGEKQRKWIAEIRTKPFPR